MATGVLSFLRGIDLTRFPLGEGADDDNSKLEDLHKVRWLKLARCGLKMLPPQIVCCKQLEELDISYNQLASLEDLTELPNLKSLVAKSNLILESSLPPEIFHADFNVLDLQSNKLRAMPQGLENAIGLLVLNLAHNQINEIEPTTFVNLCDLIHLDLSNNQLETLPAQMRRLANLRVMNLSNNPLGFAQLRQLPSLSALKELYLSNTQRTGANLPQSLEALAHSIEIIDLSKNELGSIPEFLYECTALKRLNLSENQITEVHLQIDKWQQIEVIKLSSNKLTSLPASLSKLPNVRALYLNSNQLDFEGIPKSIGKLANLEIFSAGFNQLETVPEGITRCGKLRKLLINNNKLITLPAGIHFMPELKEMDVRNNPSLVMPPKPEKADDEDEMSYTSQLRRLGQLPDEKPANSMQKKYERRIRLRKIRESTAKDDEKKDASKVLNALKDMGGKGDDNEEMSDDLTGGKNWMDNLKGPTLDYNNIFEEDTGIDPGVFVWQIDNFYPIQQDDTLHGKFYTGDCYIILHSVIDGHDLHHQIYFWIGETSSLDKKACAAVHAVNLRNMLKAKTRTSRQEMNDEDDEFLDLFDGDVCYIDGGNQSGFYLVEEQVFETRLFCIEEAAAPRIFPVPLAAGSLHPKHVLILDAGKNIYCWLGVLSKSVAKSKARLVADKISKYERKGKAEVHMVYQGYEESEFWHLLGGMPDKVRPNELMAYRGPRSPRLYKICLGQGYLELPQLNYRISADHARTKKPQWSLLPHLRLLPSLLSSKGVYILDCTGQIFVWIGKHSQRLARAAAWKLASEMSKLPGRPKGIEIRCVRELEETETGWDSIQGDKIDYTKSNLSSNETVVKSDRPKNVANMSALFLPRQKPTSEEDALLLKSEWAEDLESIKMFVLEGKKFIILPEAEKGVFYSESCYAFVCRYFFAPELPEGEEYNSDSELEEEEEVVVYFWEGRDANQLGWLTFTFTLKKNLEKMYADKLRIVRMKQQQENERFLSHFDGKFVIFNGKRLSNKERAAVENKETVVKATEPILLQMRTAGSLFTTRTVQVECNAGSLNSEFCSILIVPFSGGGTGMIYGWIGRCAEPREAGIMGELIDEKLPIQFAKYSKQVLMEGEEPENFFWVGLGVDVQQDGIPEYAQDASFMRNTRLFRCTNEQGYFTVSEKCADFCQADLPDDDVMLVDNGDTVFLWVGGQVPQPEVKFGLKAAAVYLQHLKAKNIKRKLKAVRKGREVFELTQCFHGWRQWN